MNLDQITTKCWILALFERDDGERLLLGDGWFDFKDSLQHFQPNTFANDVIELQGSDGQMLAGQVRRGAPQSFDGYIGDPITNRQTIEQHRREFLMFFRKRHHYKVVYIFPDGTAIQRKQGYITDAPSVPEIRQRFPEYHVALNFEDVNYYEYAENAQGEEIFSNIRNINISTAATGGLVWDNLGAVSDQMGWKDIATATGQMLAMTNPESIKAPIASFEMTGNTEQTTYTGKNLLQAKMPTTTLNGITCTNNGDGSYTLNGTATAGADFRINQSTAHGEDNLQNYDGTYTLSCDELQNDMQLIVMQNGTWSQLLRMRNSNTPATATFTKNGCFIYVYVAQGKTLNNLRIHPMLEKSATATAYEPYVGGIPAPNPNYPQPIETVTGRQTVGIVGKNLYDPNSTVFSVPANVSVEVDGNSVKVTALITTTSSNLYWRTPIPDSMLEDGKTYTISSVLGGGAYRSLRLLLRNHDGSNAGFSTGFSVTYDSRYTLFVVENPFATTGTTQVTAGTTCTISNIQVEEGSTATAYEPYNGQNYEINLGKNLIEPLMPTTTYNGVTCTNNGDGSFTLNGTATATATWRIEQSTGGGHDHLRTLNGTYTLSCKGVQAGVSLVVTQFNVWQIIGRVQNNETPSTFTTNLNDTLVYIAVTNGTTVNNVTVYPQLEEGSIASSYSPHFEPIELCKIGTYQDRIYKENGKWWLEKQTGKVVLNGGEDWHKSSNTQVDRYWYNIYSGDVVPAFHQIYSDKFFYEYNVPTVNAMWVDVYQTLERLFVNYAPYGTTAVTDLKTWLASDPTTVYYPLATPTTTEITNEEILEGLNSAAGLKLFPGQNNITDQTPNAQPTMTVQYYTALGPGGGLVWESGEAGGATIIEASGLDSAFPLWTVSGPSTNPTLTNITTGQSITWQGTVPAGQTLEIDMDKQTATLAGANVYAFVSGDWIRIDPGPNRMTYVGTGATQASTLSWNNIVG